MTSKQCPHGTLVRAKTGGWYCISTTGCEFSIPEPAPETPTEHPVAWVIPGDDTADMNGFISARINREGEFTKPLYARPALKTTTGLGGGDG